MTGESGESARRGRWIAWLFIIGSTLFALGAVPPYAAAVGVRADALTFFVGSVFFTAAAFLQYREAVDGLAAPSDEPRRRFWVWAPRELGWLASAVQFAGTLWFNWSTGNALRSNLASAVADARVWRPDVLGSIAFLVASSVALAGVRQQMISGTGRSRQREWWTAVLNLLGSVAFGISAGAAYVVPATDDLRNVELTNLGTFAGALCFLVGAVLLIPARSVKH